MKKQNYNMRRSFKEFLNLKNIIPFVLILIVVSGTNLAYASEPVLHFSDITSGPKTGLGDEKGSGAIVTLWGNNLGTSQGSSIIYIEGVEAAHVYYWGNADGLAMAGPSKLYESNKIQTISFSIPSSVSDGASNIYVVVNGKTSNTLPFTIRSGNIYFVKTTGNNSSGDGSWNNPWATVSWDSNGAASKVTAGDIIYVCDGVQELNRLIIREEREGTATHPISVIAYPGAKYQVRGGIQNYYWSGENRGAEYWNFAKINIETDSDGYYSFLGGRLIGSSITDITCADGQGGAIVIGRRHGGVKALGNYIFNFGCGTTSKLHHTTYITNRYSLGTPMQAPELGWNYLKDNEAPYGLHTFDEGVCGNMTGTYKIHDNVIVNQKGPGIDIVTGGTTDPCFSMDVEVYNNLLNNVGLNYSWGSAIYVGGQNNKTNIIFFNNTIYGYSEGSSISGALAIGGLTTFAGTWEWRNNIVVDTKNMPYLNSTYHKVAPSIASNNIWYNGGDGNPSSPPSWDNSPVTADPLFVAPSINDFRLTENSPAKDAGYDASNVLKRDIIGIPRVGQGTAFDIGAYELVDLIPPSKPTNLTVK